MEIKPSNIFYSHDTIMFRFRKRFCGSREHPIGETLDDLCKGTCNCKIEDIERIKITKKDGKWFTLDNRRLWVFHHYESYLKSEGKTLTIIANVVDFCQLSHGSRFTTKNGGVSISITKGSPGGVMVNKINPVIPEIEKSNDVSNTADETGEETIANGLPISDTTAVNESSVTNSVSNLENLANNDSNFTTQNESFVLNETAKETDDVTNETIEKKEKETDGLTMLDTNRVTCGITKSTILDEVQPTTEIKAVISDENAMATATQNYGTTLEMSLLNDKASRTVIELSKLEESRVFSCNGIDKLYERQPNKIHESKLDETELMINDGSLEQTDTTAQTSVESKTASKRKVEVASNNTTLDDSNPKKVRVMSALDAETEVIVKDEN